MSEHDAKRPQNHSQDRPWYPFRFAERCLYEFPENKARLEGLRETLNLLDEASSAATQKFDAPSAHTATSDNVSARLLRIEAAEEEIARLERRVKPIQRLLDDLEAPYVLDGSPKSDLLKILRLYYFGGNVSVAVARSLYINKRTLLRKRDELVRMAVRYLGL